ncbi:hypothetical protein QYM36_005372 [Artemia franciscana]|uniref:Uncharacterized protein n=1 Tax=Artemia franciscana TaxID=6661 RepID=A0AA88IDN5_ARTSF|nr:hypothetical protein QYM36_005372 [Artemia franciscana]
MVKRKRISSHIRAFICKTYTSCCIVKINGESCIKLLHNAFYGKAQAYLIASSCVYPQDPCALLHSQNDWKELRKLLHIAFCGETQAYLIAHSYVDLQDLYVLLHSRDYWKALQIIAAYCILWQRASMHIQEFMRKTHAPCCIVKMTGKS